MKKDNRLKKSVLSIIIICMIFNLLSFLLRLCSIIDTEEYIYFLCITICITYIFVSNFLIKTKGFFTIPNILWLCFFVFGISRVFMYCLGLFNFRSEFYGGMLGVFTWKDDTTIKVLNYYYLFMVTFSIVSISMDNNIRISVINHRCNILLLYLFYLSSVVTTIYFVLKALIVMRLGYASIYNGETNGIIPFEKIFSLFRLMFVVCYYFIIAYDNRRKIFLKTTIIFLFINGISLIQGSRAEFLIYLLASLCIYYYRFNRQMKTRFVILAFIFGIPFLESISYIRSGYKIDYLFFKNCYIDFFTELSGSFNIPAFYIQNMDSLNNNKYPYVFEPLVKVFQYFQNIKIYSSGQSIDMAKIRFNLGHQITYYISPDYYLQGHNYASNFIAEMEEFGILGVVVFSFIFSVLVYFIEKKIIRGSKYWTFMSFELCMWIFFAPRASVFYDTYNILKFGLIFLLGSILLGIKKKKEYGVTYYGFQNVRG